MLHLANAILILVYMFSVEAYEQNISLVSGINPKNHSSDKLSYQCHIPLKGFGLAAGMVYGDKVIISAEVLGHAVVGAVPSLVFSLQDVIYPFTPAVVDAHLY